MKNDKNSVDKIGAGQNGQNQEFQFLGKGPPPEDLIVKSNHLVEARYKLSLQEQKIILSMVSKIKKDDDHFKTIRFSVREFAELIGVRPDAYYTELKGLTKGLLEKVLLIETDDSSLQASWLASAEYYERKGVIELEFSQKMVPYLLQLRDAFIKYKLKNVLTLRSSYSIRIYELLKQYEGIGKRFFPLEELRNILDIPSDKMTRFYDFKRLVLLKSQKDLEAHTDISFDFKLVKTGRVVTGIEFFIKSQKVALENTEASEGLHSVLDLVPEQHREKKTVQNLLKMYLEQKGVDYVKRNILYTNAHLKDQRKYRTYLDKSLKADWGKGYEEDLEAERIAKEAELAKAAEEERRQADAQAEEALEEQERERLRAECEAILAGLSEEECKELECGFVETLNGYNAGRYQQYGIDYPMLRNDFLDYCMKKLNASDEKQAAGAGARRA